jgi:hypothetical protein
MEQHAGHLPQWALPIERAEGKMPERARPASAESVSNRRPLAGRARTVVSSFLWIDAARKGAADA